MISKSETMTGEVAFLFFCVSQYPLNRTQITQVRFHSNTPNPYKKLTLNNNNRRYLFFVTFVRLIDITHIACEGSCVFQTGYNFHAYEAALHLPHDQWCRCSHWQDRARSRKSTLATYVCESCWS